MVQEVLRGSHKPPREPGWGIALYVSVILGPQVTQVKEGMSRYVMSVESF